MIQIKFTDGTNPYILTNESHLYKWLYNYDVRLVKIDDGALFFVAATETRRKTYQQAKEAARMFAIDVQNIISENNFSYGEIADISIHFVQPRKTVRACQRVQIKLHLLNYLNLLSCLSS